MYRNIIDRKITIGCRKTHYCFILHQYQVVMHGSGENLEPLHFVDCLISKPICKNRTARIKTITHSGVCDTCLFFINGPL